MKSFNFLKFLNIIKNPMVHSKRSLSFVYILFIDENKFNRTKNTFWQFWIRGGPWDGSKRHRRKCWHVKAYATYDMHVTLRWLKNRTVSFLFNFSSKYPSHVKTLRWLTFFRETEQFDFWAISKLHAYAFTCQHPLRYLFEPSQGPRCSNVDKVFIWTSCLQTVGKIQS